MLRFAPLLLLPLAAGHVYEAKDGSVAEVTEIKEPGPWTISHRVASKIPGGGSDFLDTCREECLQASGDWTIDNLTMRLNGLDLMLELVPGGAPGSVVVTVAYGGAKSVTTLDPPAQPAVGDPALGLLASALAAAHPPAFYAGAAMTLEEAVAVESGHWPADVLIAAESAALFYRYSQCSGDAERGALLLDLFAAVDPD
ncbi:MAG: hypothetical protein AAF682_03915 [Planctomycetota bacterium]